MERALIPIVLALLGGCTRANVARHLTVTDFEQLKKDCVAPDAYLIEGKERGVTFNGVRPSQIERAREAACLADRLRGTDVRFVGFLSINRPSASGGS